MVKRKSIRQISEGTAVRIEFIDNLHGYAMSDLDVHDLALHGLPTLVVTGDVIGRNKDYILVACQHPVDNSESQNGYLVVGVLWKCIEKLEVLKPCSRYEPH